MFAPLAQLPLLSILTFMPLLGVLLLLLLPKKAGDGVAKQVGVWTSLLTFGLSLTLLGLFDPANTGFQLVESHPWLSLGKVALLYKKGIDGIALWFVLASTFLMPLCMLAAWDSIKQRVREFMIALLVLEAMLIGLFSSLDMVLFYVFFEGVLLPMFFIIGVWGGKARIYAAYKMFLYTFLGSVLMLVAIIAMCSYAGTTDMVALFHGNFPASWQNWLWLAFFASFAVKTPLWPVHTWLPYAHVEAPTTGSVILAGILLKMGGYGFIRISLQMLPTASAHFAPLMLGLAAVAILYASLVALVQEDMKKLIAYSSVAHMGYVVMGIFSGNAIGLEGAMLVMLSHTLVASALFLCVGVLYDRLHTRDIARYGGVAKIMPRFAVFALFFTMASIGLPGTSGFIGEFLAMQGVFMVNSWVAAIAGLGVILGAAYMLVLYRRVFYGKLDKADVAAMPDLTWKEWAVFLPLTILVLWLGIQPAYFKNMFSPTINAILSAPLPVPAVVTH